MKKSVIDKVELIYVLQESSESNPDTLKEIKFRNMAEIKSVRDAGYIDDDGKSYFYSYDPTLVGKLHPIAQLKITRKSGMVVWRNTNTEFTED